MRKIQFSIILTLILAAVGCSKERDYFVETTTKRSVNFTAYNTTVGQGDSAVSTIYYRYFDPEWDYDTERADKISFDFLERYYGDPDWYETRNFETTLNYVNMLWSGGNNEISLTFRPSCPEERSATFTFPDGTKAEVSASQPTCYWTLDSASYQSAEELWGNSYELPIYAESEYTIEGIEYRNIGYVLVGIYDMGNSLLYNREDNTWYMEYWPH